MPVTDSYNRKLDEKLGPIASKVKELPIVVGGSAVVSTISDDEYPGSDIDIYVGYKLIRREDKSIASEFDDWIVNELGGVLVMNVNYQDKSYKYICPDITVNIIHTGRETKEDIIQYIHETSDLDICTSTYDGFFARFPCLLLAKQARIINSHLINTTFESQLEGDELLKAYERFSYIFNIKRKTRQYKYIQRGFRISDAHLDDNDEYGASVFISQQTYKEELVRHCLKFVVSKITENTSQNGSKTLADILKGKQLFNAVNDIPILPVHSPLTFDAYPWARKWIHD